MKKLLFSLAVLITMSSFVFAQAHVGTVSQTGTANTGTISQLGAQANNGSITTVGDYNDATILQKNNGFGGGSLDGVIGQTGIQNHALINQAPGGAATFGHDATISQTGDVNSADITQFDGQPSTAAITQIGNYNDADQVIYSDGQMNSSASAYQQGTANTALQNLGNGGYITDGHFTATQVGDYNKSTQVVTSSELFPLGSSLLSKTFNGTVTQYGVQNTATMLMTAGSVLTSTIYQQGDVNIGATTQTGTGHNASVTQVGNYNNGSVTQGL